MGLDKDYFFVQGLKSPECVKLLFNCLQNLETETKNVKEISLAAKEWRIKDTEQLKEMNSEIAFINHKFLEFGKEIKNSDEEIKSLRKENSCLPKRLEEMGQVLDGQEQYFDCNILLPFDYSWSWWSGRLRHWWIVYKSNRRAFESKN